MSELQLAADARFWGKAQPPSPHSASHHLLALHSLDVAAVAESYLLRNPRCLDWLAGELGTQDLEALRRWLVFWVALHDLGKFSLTFQAQWPVLLDRHQMPRDRALDSARHDTLGAAWAEQAEQLLPLMVDAAWFPGADDDALRPWLQAVTGHHGKPPEPQVKGDLRDHFPAAHRQAALMFARQMLTLLQPAAPWMVGRNARDTAARSKRTSWWLAGLTVLADWLGSNADFFPYQTEESSLSDYWIRAKQVANAALDASGVLPAEQGPEQPFHALFPAITTPSPLQAFVRDLALTTGPQLHILEDATGAGKTEAAMLLTHRLMAQGVAEGFYVGLPTMATAHALYDRIKTYYQQLFGDSHPSLALATGSANLVESFATSVLPEIRRGDAPLREADSAEARCQHWLADHSKRALLAPAGVGTIDQALLAALKSKHQSLRLLGLMGKVLVVDEVHACDLYMERVLCALLSFHAHAGGSAILLSATLTERMKHSLMSAFAAGTQAKLPSWQARRDYPLATRWAAHAPDEILQQPMAARSELRRTLAVQALASREAVAEALLATLQAGGCAAWICNSVADALELHALMAARWPAERITLFHARFALADRLAIEGKVLAALGAQSTAQARRGQLLIATQVAEQSLDIDVDLLASDLAPIDRLIQRAGRLHRHRRSAAGERLGPGQSDQRPPPQLLVHTPAWEADPAPSWLRNALPRTARVYDNPAVLWRSAQLLQAGQWQMPEQARTFVEQVFAAEEEAPAGLTASANASEGKALADASLALHNTLQLAKGYERDGNRWEDDATAPTRLGEPCHEVRLARWDGQQLRPWAERPSHAWAYSTVRVPTRLIQGVEAPEDPALHAAWEQLCRSLPGADFTPLLPLVIDADGSGRAWVRNARGQCQSWHYSSLTGLRAEAAGGSASGQIPTPVRNARRHTTRKADLAVHPHSSEEQHQDSGATEL